VASTLAARSCRSRSKFSTTQRCDQVAQPGRAASNSGKSQRLLGGYDTTLVQAQQGVPDQYKIPMVEGGGAASAIFHARQQIPVWHPGNDRRPGNITMDFSSIGSSDGQATQPLKIALAWENTDHGKDYQAAVNKAAKDDPAHFLVVLDNRSI